MSRFCFSEEISSRSNQNFSLPKYFQVKQVLEKLTWNKHEVHVWVIESNSSLKQLVDRLAVDIPTGALLSGQDEGIQFSWKNDNVSHLLELNKVSSHKVNGTYSTISFAENLRSEENLGVNLMNLIPRDSIKLFEFSDYSENASGVQISAYQSKLPVAKLLDLISINLISHGWTILKYPVMRSQSVSKTIDAVMNNQQLNVSVHSEHDWTGINFIRTIN